MDKMETEIVQGLSSGEIVGGSGGILGALIVSLGLWFKNKSDKKTIDGSAVVIDAITKISEKNILANKELANMFIAHLEKSAEKQATINQSFTKVYDKIESEAEKADSQIKNIENNWVHTSTFKAEMKSKQDK